MNAFKAILPNFSNLVLQVVYVDHSIHKTCKHRHLRWYLYRGYSFPAGDNYCKNSLTCPGDVFDCFFRLFQRLLKIFPVFSQHL